MKASRCPTAFAARMFAVLTPVVLLVQCSMPPQQAWSYIQTNGLLPYLNAHQSPPFGTSGSRPQSYAAYPQRRYTPTSNWFSNWNWSSGMMNRSRYAPTNPSGYASNNYFSSPSSGSGRSRYVPRSRPSHQSDDRSSGVKIPVEEPSHAPQIANNPPPVSPTQQTNGGASTSPPVTENLPYGTAVPGRMNMVNSPHAGKTQLVDVSGMSAGQTVKCPYTGKLFKVPPTQQAANHAEPRLESKVEAPKLSEESKGGDKKP